MFTCNINMKSVLIGLPFPVFSSLQCKTFNASRPYLEPVFLRILFVTFAPCGLCPCLSLCALVLQHTFGRGRGLQRTPES